MKILSLSGGGIKGLLGLTIINYIETQTGKRTQDLFDGFAGSSTGAITAIGLAKKNPLSAKELIQLYLAGAKAIFPKPWYRQAMTAWGLKDDKYPVEGLEGLLKSKLGSATMKGGLAKPVCITTVDATILQPIVLDEQSEGWQLWETGRASSAGPTFFAPFIKNGHAYVDGGICANVPDCVAISHWLDLDTKDSFMLSLGTGFQQEGWKPADLENIGALRWATKVITIALDGVARQTVDEAKGSFLSGDYLRIDPFLPNQLGDMDETDPAKLRQLVNIGERAVTANRATIDGFISKLLCK